ncbi:MAG: DNA gyrase modulator [Synergistaceae bacterium]|nr:DNA gyrase modulator [Synergistaceae bacterium]
MQEELFRCRRNVSYADLYIQKAVTHFFHFEDGKMEQVTSSISDGVGARIIKNGHSFLSSSDGTSIKNALLALKTVAVISGEKPNFEDDFKGINIYICL